MLKIKCLIWSLCMLLAINLVQAQKIADYKMTPYQKDLNALEQLYYEPKDYMVKLEELIQKVKSDTKYLAKDALLLHLEMKKIENLWRNEDDSDIKIINALEAFAAQQQGVHQNIVYAIIAESYANYLQNNLWKLRDRTNVDNTVQLEDKATWDIQRWADGIMKYHELSLQGESIKNTATKLYMPLLTQQFEDESDFVYEIQSSLYDVLVNKTLNFYKSEYNYLNKPAEVFYLDDEKSLADLNTFLAWNPQTKDVYSNQYKAIKLYQNWLQFNLDKGNKIALVYADLSRLQYAHDKNINENKTPLFEKTFQNLRNTHKNTKAGFYLDYQYANYLINKPVQANEENKNPKLALEIINNLLKNSQLPSFLKSPIEALKNTILNKHFNIQIEGAIATNKPALVHVTYKNIDKLYYRIIERTNALEQAIEDANKYDRKITYEQQRKNLFQTIAKAKSIQNGIWNLAQKEDFLEHNTEVYFKGISSGKYYLLVSYNEKFEVQESNALSYHSFAVSNLHYLVHNDQKSADLLNQISGFNNFYVLNRISGQPIQGAVAEVYGGQKLKNKLGIVTSDANGFLNLKDIKNTASNYYDRNYKLVIKKDKEVLETQVFYANNYYNNNAYLQQSYHLFLDRGIYRPGQTLYFKGIALIASADGKSHKVLANQKVTITLKDANYQDQKTLSLNTNEYGAFSGTFVLPTTGMTGIMYLLVNGEGVKDFSVEEYKRPQFFVEMLPIKTAYKLEDQVKAEGKAMAYAGNALSEATVKYRIVREVRFPYWSWRWGYNPFTNNTQEIAQGETKTNDKGEFTIDFKAIPDKSIPLKNKPQFTYTIYVDVVDITGETHTKKSTLVVGTIAQNITLDIPTTLDKNANNKLTITSKNLNGEYEASKGKIKIVALQTPQQIYNKRQWAKPDLKSIPEAEFKKLFPEFAYDKEDDQQYWAEKNTVWEGEYNTESSKDLDLSAIMANWSNGVYRIALTTKDKYGEEIIVEKEIEVYDSKSNILSTYKPLYTLKDNYLVAPDTMLYLTLGATNNAYVLAIVDIDGIEVFKNWVKVSQLHTIPFEVKEEHRDKITASFYTFINNRFYTQTINIQIPYTNKDLKIELMTFRDKLLPGQQEEWKFKVSGAKGEKVMAELLAGMYDASLDAFAENKWHLPKPRNNRNVAHISIANLYSSNNAYQGNKFNPANFSHFVLSFADLKGISINNYYGVMSGAVMATAPMMKARSNNLEIEESITIESDNAPIMMDNIDNSIDGQSLNTLSEKNPEPSEAINTADTEDIQVRTNLKETVFFYPEVQIDAEGNYLVAFKMNEALTKWKLMLLAHTKDLDWAYEEQFVITQKDLMVQPNAPRFFRQGDTIHFPAKISNLTTNSINGQATLMLFDAATMQPIDAILGNNNAMQNFAINAENNTMLSWRLIVPEDFTSAITYRVVAKTATMSDGEENALPVVSNRILITESMPLPIRGGKSKKFDFKRMNEVMKGSKTLQNHAFTLEFTQNPAWYAVQALPYLMEYPYECSEQIFSRYYANALATKVANSTPKIKQVFDQWVNIDTNAIKSNLHKNQELKYALLEETPWVMAAENEASQKRNIGLLFDLNKMSNELTVAKNKLLKNQLSNGAFPWFAGDKDNWYITQYIVQGMAHLKAMNALPHNDVEMQNAMQNAVAYIDNQLLEYYQKYIYVLKQKEREENRLSSIVVHYLYARSFYLKEIPLQDDTKEVVAYFAEQAKKYWTKESTYSKGLIALYAHRTGNTKLAQEIVKSLKQSAINSEEMGMYWKGQASAYWYEMPIETHTLMIELFAEVAQDMEAVEDMKTWLLKNKQTTSWKTTKATAGAVYALLSHGVNLIEENNPIDIKIGGKKLDMNTIKQEAGTGYFKQRWEKDNFDNSFANIEVKNNNKVVAWGAAYWQYFEDLDKVTSFEETPLKINKEVFVQKNTATGPMLTPMKDGSKVNVGDLIKVRIEIRVDRAMEYVHLKDMRAAGLEPINTISAYKYQGGLGYYENTRDLASNFFISYLPKGTYVFEYELRATYKGNYSNGVTTMQCMYAPEFTSHSKGIRLTIE